MVHRLTTESRDAKAAGTAKTTATIRVPATGVEVFGETFSKTRGISPSRDMDMRMQVWPYITARTTEAMATTPPPTEEPVTSLTTYDSAAGRPPTPSPPMAPMPPRPAGEKGVRLPSLKAVNTIAQKATRIASFSTAVAGSGRDRCGQLQADEAVEELVDVLAPAHRDGRHRDAVLDEQTPADQEGGGPAESGVGEDAPPGAP